MNDDALNDIISESTQTAEPVENTNEVVEGDTKLKGDIEEKQAESDESANEEIVDDDLPTIKAKLTAAETQGKRQRAANHDLNRKFEEQAAIIAELREAQEATKVDNSGEPQEDDFESMDDYIQAKADWTANEKFKELETKRVQELELQQQQYKMAEAKKKFDEAEAKYRVDVPDYDKVIEVFNQTVGFHQETPTLQSASKALMEAENVPALGYHLGNNPSKIDEILSMTPDKAYRAVVKLEVELSTANTPKKVTRKPNSPPNPIKGNGKASKGLDNMNPDELMSWVNS